MVRNIENDRQIFHSSAEVIASYSDIDKAFISMYQSIMTKVKNYAYEDWDVLDEKIIRRFRCIN